MEKMEGGIGCQEEKEQLTATHRPPLKFNALLTAKETRDSSVRLMLLVGPGFAKWAHAQKMNR